MEIQWKYNEMENINYNGNTNRNDMEIKWKLVLK